MDGGSAVSGLLAGLLLGAAVSWSGAAELSRDLGEVDLRELVLLHAPENQRQAQEYSYQETVTVYDIEKDGTRVPRPARTYLVTPIGNHLYRRLIRIGGQPLRDRLERNEEEQERVFRTQVEKDPEQEGSRWRRRMRVEDLLDRFEYRMEGVDWIDGRRVYRLGVSPGEWKEAWMGRLDSIFRNLEGTVWIDGEDYQVIRFQGHLRKRIRWGWGLVATLNRFDLNVDQGKVNDQVWMPAQVTYTVEGSAFIFGRHRRATVSRYHDFQRVGDLISGGAVFEGP